MTKACIRGVLSPTMIPIYKKGKVRSKAGSYRPIRPKTFVGNVMERIINARLILFLENHQSWKGQVQNQKHPKQERDLYRRCTSRWRALTHTLHYLHERHFEWNPCIYPWCFVSRWPSNVVLLRTTVPGKLKFCSCVRYVRVLWGLHFVHGKPLKQERTGTESATPKQERDLYRRCTSRWRALTHTLH